MQCRHQWCTVLMLLPSAQCCCNICSVYSVQSVRQACTAVRQFIRPHSHLRDCSIRTVCLLDKETCRQRQEPSLALTSHVSASTGATHLHCTARAAAAVSGRCARRRFETVHGAQCSSQCGARQQTGGRHCPRHLPALCTPGSPVEHLPRHTAHGEPSWSWSHHIYTLLCPQVLQRYRPGLLTCMSECRASGRFVACPTWTC